MKLLALEIIASCLVVAGICIEVLAGGEAGYILISVGSVGIMAGGILYSRIFIKSHNQTPQNQF